MGEKKFPNTNFFSNNSSNTANNVETNNKRNSNSKLTSAPEFLDDNSVGNVNAEQINDNHELGNENNDELINKSSTPLSDHIENPISNSSNTMNIPEFIDPGITIPIYEETIDDMDIQQPQKLGSYRARAGKFSNTLSNLLPSISAKLHHSKKNNKNITNVNNNSSTNVGNSSSESSIIFSNSPDTTIKPNTGFFNKSSNNNNNNTTNNISTNTNNNLSTSPNISSTNSTPFKQTIAKKIKFGRFSPSKDPIIFPNSTNHILDLPRTSNDSFTYANVQSQTPLNNGLTSTSNKISRTRHNTMSSQLTNMSSIGPQSGTIWSNNNNDAISQHLLHLADPTATLNNTLTVSNSNNHDINPMNTNNTNTNNLSIPTHNNKGNRQRSASNASSIYLDAPLYDQQSFGRPRASSTFTYRNDIESIPPVNTATTNLNNNNTFNDNSNANIPYVCDDVDPVSLNWVSTDINVPSINQLNNLLPTNTISISNVYPLQQQQPYLTNTVNLTSTSLATLCSKFGEVKSARALRDVNIALVEFETVQSAVKALTALQGKEVSMVGMPSTVCFAKILPMHTHQSSTSIGSGAKEVFNQSSPQSLLQEQLLNGSVTFQQQGSVSVPMFNNHQLQQYYQSNQFIPQNQMHYQNQSQGQTPYQNYQQQIQVSPHLSHHYNHSYNQSASQIVVEKELCPFPLPPPNVSDEKSKVEELIFSFESRSDRKIVEGLLNRAYNFKGTSETTNYGPLPESIDNKLFDPPKLREIRKNIDNNVYSNLDLEQLALCMLDELPELSSDYLGNTVVQKLFESSSDIIKDIMLRKSNKYLTSMGVHKNGTWACQKMITMARTPRQINLIVEGLHDYCVPLLTDQFGNYVIQCVLKFGSTWNNFIFESIVANFWTIVQNRYGARAVRACLEAHDIVTTEQTLILSGLIVFYAHYLATNNNSTLLLTWFLDTCVFPKRYSILVPRLVPRMVQLCCHRLASLTVLKILNFRGDNEARTTTLHAIFGDYHQDEPPEALRLILNDTNNGPTFIYKVLSMPLLEDDVRIHVVKQVCKVVKEIPSAQQHRRLMEEIGLSTSANIGINDIGNNGNTSNTNNNNTTTATSKGNIMPVGINVNGVSLANNNNGGGNVNATVTGRKSISQVFSNDSPQKHMRGISISSVLSNNSRHSVFNSGSNDVGQPSNTTSTYSTYYSNYPGSFPNSNISPANNKSNNNNYNNKNVAYSNTNVDDIASHLDMFYLNNGTHISLPQLSVTNQDKNITMPEPSAKNNHPTEN